MGGLPDAATSTSPLAATSAVAAVCGISPAALDSLMLCAPHSGRTHQTRLYLRLRGHPIVGDDIYGATVRTGSGQPPPSRQAERVLVPTSSWFTISLPRAPPRAASTLVPWPYDSPRPPARRSFGALEWRTRSHPSAAAAAAPPSHATHVNLRCCSPPAAARLPRRTPTHLPFPPPARQQGPAGARPAFPVIHLLLPSPQQAARPAAGAASSGAGTGAASGAPSRAAPCSFAIGDYEGELVLARHWRILHLRGNGGYCTGGYCTYSCTLTSQAPR